MIEKAILAGLIFPGFIFGVGPVGYIETALAAISVDPTATLGVAAAMIGALTSYIVAARRFSGKIETTEAKDLWAESRAIRKWSQDRIGQLNDLVARLEKRNAELEARIDRLENENTELHQEIADKVRG